MSRTPGAVMVLTVFSGSGFIAVGHTPPVPAFVMPGTGLCSPSVGPDISWPLVHIDVNIMAVPIEIAPGAKTIPEVKGWPV